MPYFGTRDITCVVFFATLWGILNSLVSPIFFKLFNLPFLCDLVGFASLILAVWWVRKLGTATLTGFIATLINFILNPGGFHFLGFTVASMVFDAFVGFAVYRRLFEHRWLSSIFLLAVSTFSAAVAGLIIGMFLMDPVILKRWGGALVWAGLHAAGGVIGGTLGVLLINVLAKRGIRAGQIEG